MLKKCVFIFCNLKKFVVKFISFLGMGSYFFNEINFRFNMLFVFNLWLNFCFNDNIKLIYFVWFLVNFCILILYS